ncbi:hypothetical protein ACN47E_002009 [Coniothyrium glycines]
MTENKRGAIPHNIVTYISSQSKLSSMVPSTFQSKMDSTGVLSSEEELTPIQPSSCCQSDGDNGSSEAEQANTQNTSNFAEQDEDSDDEGFRDRIMPFDLKKHKALLVDNPIYTRALLESMAKEVRTIKEMLEQESSHITRELSRRAQNGLHYKTWVEEPGSHHTDVLVNFLTRVELHPEFQQQARDLSTRLQQLHTYNPDLKGQYLLAPYYFTTYERPESVMYENEEQMRPSKTQLAKTKVLWTESKSRSELLATITRSISSSSKRITKIVCFGLGSLRTGQAWYCSVLQHMTVFSIAAALDRQNRLSDPRGPKVKIIFQDPCYVKQDRITLKELYSDGGAVEFVSDPEGLLAVDSETLVVTAFLPTTVPLMQILADLFGKSQDQGPAMILADDMYLAQNKREYCMGDRAAPHVVNWLEGAYDQDIDVFYKYVLEDPLYEDIYGESLMGRFNRYWLTQMGLWTRK